MADRPYLTTAEAAAYCGFKTIGGIQQAVRRGKLKPAGRRGGTGTFVFTRDDLDAFLTGGLAPHGRLFMPPPDEAGGPPSATYQPRARAAAAPSAGYASPPRRHADSAGDLAAASGSGASGTASTSTRRSRATKSKMKEPADPIDRICRALEPVRTPVVPKVKDPKAKKRQDSAQN